MSANYWNSTQRGHWQFTREQLAEKRGELVHLENKMFTGDNSSILQLGVKYDHNLRIYLHNLVLKLGRKLCLRQVILATAEVFISRFLTQVSVKEVNLYMLVTTAIYVACKIEEYPQHIRNVLNESRNVWPEYIPNDLTKIAEFEFYLIEELDSYLVVHHPYQALLNLVQMFNSVEQTDFKLGLSNEEIQMCWSVTNDSFITDLPLLFPPHITAVMSVYMTIALKADQAKNNSQQQQKLDTLTRFLAVSKVDLAEVIEATQEMLTLYEQWDSYDEHYLKKNLHALLMALSRSGL